MGDNTCMRCGKPCGQGETMCEECKVWFAQQTAGDAGQKSFKKLRMPGRSRAKAEPAAEKRAAAPQPSGGEALGGAGYAGGSAGRPAGDGKGQEARPAGVSAAGASAPGADRSAGGGQFCPKCGKRMPAEARFCTGCGNELRRPAQNAGGAADAGVRNGIDGGNPAGSAKNGSAREANGPGNVGGTAGTDTGKPSGSGAKKILIAAAALVLVVALIFGVKMILGSRSENKGTQQASSSEGSNGNGIGKVVDEESEEEKAAREQAEKEQQEKEQREKEEEERLRKEQEEKERAEREAQEKAARELAIHSYEIVIADCTWEQAYEDCKNRGGYLVRINSADEYRHIVGLLQNYSKIHFYLGGKRDAEGRDYYWVDTDGAYMGECLNLSDSWTGEFWFRDEPSFVDTGSGGQGRSIEEAYMNLFCVSGTWYLNDSSGSLAADYPDLLSGKVGYIVEYE